MANELIKTNQNEIVAVDNFNKDFGLVRTILLNGETWLCGKDICEMLGYLDPRSAINRHVSEANRVKHLVWSHKQNKKMILINSHGFYELCQGSKLETANQIKDWIKTKFFTAVEVNNLPAIKEQIINDDYFVDAMVDKICPRIGIAKEKVDGFDRFLDSEGLMTVGSFAKCMAIPNLGKINMFKLLREKGFCYYEKGCNVPKQHYVNDGLAEIRYSSDASGKHVTPQTMLTAKGVEYLRLKLKEWGITK